MSHLAVWKIELDSRPVASSAMNLDVDEDKLMVVGMCVYALRTRNVGRDAQDAFKRSIAFSGYRCFFVCRSQTAAWVLRYSTR